MNYSRTYFAGLLNEFDEKFSGLNFTHGKTNFYPLVKLHFSYQLYLLYLKEKPLSLGNDKIEIRKLSLSRQLYYSFRIKLSELKIFRNANKTASTLLVGLKEHDTKIKIFGDKEIQNPFIAPFEKLLTEASIPFDSMYSEDLFSTKPVKKIYFCYKFLHALEVFKLSNNVSLISNLYAVEQFSEQKGIKLKGLADFLFKNIAENEVKYYYWKQFFNACKYKKVLHYCYYHNYILALNRAARELGLKTIEYQHSLQSDNHFAYSKWSKNINNGINYFPSLFWVWTELDKRRIENNFNQLYPTPEVFNGSNVYLGLQHQFYSANFKREDNVILIALQGFWMPQFLEDYIKSDNQFKWYIRLHPRYPSDRLKAMELYSAFPDKIIIDEANSKNLFELLAKAKFTITAFSGVAIEAQTFGSQVIIFSEDGFQAYKHYIEEGAFFYIKETSDLTEILNSANLLNSDFNFIDVEQDKLLENVIKIFNSN